MASYGSSVVQLVGENRWKTASSGIATQVLAGWGIPGYHQGKTQLFLRRKFGLGGKLVSMALISSILKALSSE